MASFNSTDLGTVVEMTTVLSPKQRQVNAYPGINGLQLIDHGTRGATTRVRGILSGSGRAGLSTVFDTFRGYQTAGGKATLVDVLGKSWTNVILVVFQPIGQSGVMAGGVNYCQQYEAEFFHPDE